jgi:diaminopimelate epimerase
MNIPFYKYHGTGNDFVMIDNRSLFFPKENKEIVHHLCDRHFGIGADGLILLENDAISDFKMIYFNADGSESTMCGNGGRCIVSFAHFLKIFSHTTTFSAMDGLHYAEIKNDLISLQMIDVREVKMHPEYVFTNTGSPHHVQLVSNIADFPVFSEGKKIRTETYGKDGANINFVEKIDEHTFKVRTYERGVENETLACGTGVTAVAIAMHKTKNTYKKNIHLKVVGGELDVTFEVENDLYKNVFLKGPATQVFKGTIDLQRT